MAKDDTSSRFASGLLTALLLVTAVAVFTPFAPRQPSAGLDPSWELALNQAVAQGLVFGRDIIFTFGPYASVYTQMFHPATDHLMVLGGLSLGLSFSLTAVLNLWRAPLPSQLALILLLASIAVMRDALFFLYPLLIGTCILGAPKRLMPLSSPMLLALLSAPLGLMPLVKQPLLAATLAVVLLSAAVLAGRKRWDLLATLLAAPLLAMVLFWLLAGQPAAALPDYFLSASEIIRGYPDAMSVPGSPLDIAAYVVTCGLVALTVFNGLSDEHQLTRAAGTLMFLALLFLAFKSGFIRHDQHALIAGGFVLLCSLVAAALYAPSPPVPLLICATLTFAMIVNGVPGAAGAMTAQIAKTYAGMWTGLQQRLLAPRDLQTAFDRSLAEIRQAGGTPAVAGTSDIYAYDQAGLIAAGNRWNPRPVLQSYAAFTPALAQADRLHLSGDRAPDAIVFRLETIDGRLPSLEDGPSWRVLLSRYALKEMTANALVLLRKGDAHGTELTLLPSQSSWHRLGETVALEGTKMPLYAKIHLRKTLLGQLWSMAYKPSEIAIVLETAEGRKPVFRLVPGMAESEFLLSPLIETTKEFGLLFGTRAELAGNEVRSLALEDTGWPGSWAADYRLELLPTPAVSGP